MSWLIRVRVIPLLLKNIQPPPVPVILHGDLWSGNKGMATGRPGSSAASPAIFDPAAYFGHNEADLGIMYMFGGKSLPVSLSMELTQMEVLTDRILGRLL